MQLEDSGPCTGVWSEEASGAACDLGSAPVWRSRASVAAGGDTINSAAAEALLAAHDVALQNQAERLRAEASANLAAALQKQQELLAASQQENQLLQQDIEAQRQQLQRQADQRVDDKPAAAVGDETESLRNQLATARSILRLAVLDKAFTETPAAELLSLPASALQGVGGKTATALEAVGIATVGDLASWKVVGDARAACAQDGSAPAVGLASCTVEAQTLQTLRLKTAEDVAEWKFAVFAEAMALQATDRQED